MSNTFLDDEEGISLGGKGSFAKYQLKIRHLNDLNKKIYMENDYLRLKVKDLEKEKAQFVSTNFDQNTIIQNFQRELIAQRARNHELSKQNEELLAKILLNEQLNIQAKKQFDLYLNRYEEKVLQLRQSLQIKEVQIQTLEDKYEAFKGLQLPISIKNANRYTVEMLKYESLIDELIQERNRDRYKNMEDIQNGLKYFDSQLHGHKSKKNKITQSAVSHHTDIRSKNNQLFAQSQYSSKFFGKDKIDVVFLRLHLQLRQLKKKYKQQIEKNIELKNKDEIMKQGYLTLTKEMEKVKIENCQLKIQLQHLDKKIKTTKEISAKFISLANVDKRRRSNTLRPQIITESQVSIDANLSQVKRVKLGLPSQTKYDTLSVNKSHTFDQKIQNIHGLLSLDSNPDLSPFKSRKQVILEGDQDEDLSISEQNEVDMSISLDTSGFDAPRKSHYQISQYYNEFT